jgi:hypothetical protein
MYAEFWRVNILGSGYLKEQEGNGRIILKWMIGKYVTLIGDGRKWYSDVPNRVFKISIAESSDGY